MVWMFAEDLVSGFQAWYVKSVNVFGNPGRPNTFLILLIFIMLDYLGEERALFCSR